MPRGGKRTGTPGQAYPNRSDLPTAPDPGAGTFKGQPYGAATAQAQVQGSAAQPPMGGGGPPLPAATPGPAPGSFGDLGRPTERPNEPVTSGIAFGPGPGPTAQPAVSSNAKDLLTVLGSSPGASPEVRTLLSFMENGKA